MRGTTIRAVTSSTLAEIDAQYRQLREDCAAVRRSSLRLLAASGAEAGEYLQSQLTNDLDPLEPGTGIYAALLDRKARDQADMNVLRLSDGEYWLVLEERGFDAAQRHLDMYRIGREAEVGVPEPERVIISLVGPAVEQRTGISPGPPFSSRPASVAGTSCIAVSAPVGDTPGLDLLLEQEAADDLLERLATDGVPEVSESALEILRIEAGLPRFGQEIDDTVMPAEAGLVESAVSFEKGCYIGQEPVARLHYKGRPNRRLRRLALSAAADPGEELWLEDRKLGVLTSSCISPARGPLGLAVVRREAEPGATIKVGSGDVTAVVESIESGS